MSHMFLIHAVEKVLRKHNKGLKLTEIRDAINKDKTIKLKASLSDSNLRSILMKLRDQDKIEKPSYYTYKLR